MKFEEILLMKDGPERTAALAYWIQHLYPEGTSPSRVRMLGKDTAVIGAFNSLWKLAGRDVKRKPNKRAVENWIEEYSQ